MPKIATDKVVMVRQLLTKEKIAKINWIIAITNLTYEELKEIAQEEGFKIKGEYIALRSETNKIPKKSDYLPLVFSLDQIPEAYKYCPYCGSNIEKTQIGELISDFCTNCGQNLKEIFGEPFKREYLKKRCLICGVLNSKKASYCTNCASLNFF